MAEIIYQRHWQRRDTAANLKAANEVLFDGEFCYETDTGALKIGDGNTPYNDLAYLVAPFFAVATGADTITATFPCAPELVDGLDLRVRAAAANTGAATFNPNALGALDIKKHGGSTLGAGDIAAAGHELVLRYVAGSPGHYELLNPGGASGGGGSTPTGTGFRHVTAGAEDAAAVTIDGQSAASGGDVKIVGPAIHAAAAVTLPIDADEFGIWDAVTGFLGKMSWASLKAGIFSAWGALVAAGTAKTTPASGDSFAISDSAASGATKRLTIGNLFASPALTGTPTAPTASSTNNTTQIATCAMVQSAVAAGPSGTGAWTVVRKLNDTTRVSTTTLADDPELTITLAAATRYHIRVFFFVTSGGSPPGIKINFNYTGTLASAKGRRIQVINGSPITGAVELALFNNFFSTLTVDNYFEWDYTIMTTTGGTLTLQWCQNGSSPTAITVNAGSFIEYMTC